MLKIRMRKMDKQAVRIEEKVHSYIRSNHMLDNCRHIVVGVSGGADSVCLLLMLCDYVKKHKMDICIHAVHVNHMIRQEAADDENFTRKLCESVGVDCYAAHIDCIGIAKEKGLTVEEAGRLERYRIFDEIAKKYKDDGGVMIAVAHHMNDQAETVLMNMARGTSLKGVRGIVPVRDNICRPLLCITRSQIESVLSAKDQPYVTDVTNFDNDYTRNAIRNVILPYMCEHINQKAVENISSMAVNIREAEEYMDRQADRLYSECVSEKDDTIRMSVLVLKSADMVLVKRVIYRCLVELAGRAKDIYSVNVSDIAALMDMQTGRKIHSVYGIYAIREYDDIVLRKRQDKSCIQGKDGGNADNIGSGAEPYAENVCEYDVEVDISALGNIDGCTNKDIKNTITQDTRETPSSITINIGKNIYIPGEGGKYAESITFSLVDKKTLSTDEKNTPDNAKICVNKSNNGYAKYYDYDKINKLLNVRFRKPQDDIVVSKTGNVKKLKKELVDRKIPSSYRQEILLVCDNNHVLWACGVRRSESCLVDNTTSRVLEILINVKERN